MSEEKEFDSLKIPFRNRADRALRMKYRVYRDPVSYEVVEAESVIEAIKLSGINDPSRVIKEEKFYEDVVTNDFIDALTATPSPKYEQKTLVSLPEAEPGKKDSESDQMPATTTDAESEAADTPDNQ